MLSDMKLRGAWRKIRSKIGIRSEKVAIKSHMPWYVKFAGYGFNKIAIIVSFASHQTGL